MLEIDGISKGMYHALRRKEFSHIYVEKTCTFIRQVQFLSIDGVSDILKYSKCNNTA